MASIVGVHGIAQQFKAPALLASEWEPSLRGGVELAGGDLPEHVLRCASYGQAFRPPGEVRGAEHSKPSDVGPEEARLLELLVAEAIRAEPERYPRADANLRASTPGSVQALLRLATKSRFLAGIAANAFIGNLKQVTRYMNDPAIRTAAQRAVDEAVTADTRVIVSHSLGTVVAYEAIATFAGSPNWANVKTLVTMGSPLGIASLIFDKLIPAPIEKRGRWPAGIDRWTNISDDGDIVALEKKLGPLFGGALVDIRISNGSTAHDVSPYLTARETGRAILEGLA